MSDAMREAFNTRWRRNVEVSKLPCDEPILDTMQVEFAAGWQAALETQARREKELIKFVFKELTSNPCDEVTCNYLIEEFNKTLDK